MAAIALFDLDETLVCEDTATAWSCYAVEQKMISDDGYLSRGKHLYQEYLAGCLDIVSYTEYSLLTVKDRTPEEVSPVIETFIEKHIRKKVYEQAWQLLEKHRDMGHHLLLISASSSHIVHPIGKMLGMDTSIGCDPEIVNNRYSGKMKGVPSFREGKVDRFRMWVEDKGINVNETWFYSDSPNDLPLLEHVDHPVATNPVTSLEAIAKERKWPVLNWKKP